MKVADNISRKTLECEWVKMKSGIDWQSLLTWFNDLLLIFLINAIINMSMFYVYF